MLTALERLEMRLQRLGYVILYLRQPIPGQDSPGVVAYCSPEQLKPGYNGSREFSVQTVAERY